MNYPREFTPRSHLRNVSSVKIYTDFEPLEDSFDNSSIKRKFNNASNNFDEDFNNIRHYSQNKDKKTMDEFNAIMQDFSHISDPIRYYPRLQRGPLTPIVLHRTSHDINHCYRPLSFIDKSNYDLDCNNLPTRNLKAHPKIMFEVVVPEEVTRTIPETESEMKKRLLDERLDKLLGYRAPRYRLSSETRNCISSLEGSQIRRLFNNNQFNENDDENFDIRPKLKFINHNKHIYPKA